MLPNKIIPLILCLTLGCILLMPSLVSAHALVGGNGSISGQLLDGTNHNAPLPKQTVTLQMAQGPNASDLTTATTDDHGAFTFNNLATDKTIGYAVYIRYQGAQYVSDVVTLDANPIQHLNLTVYEATSNTAKVAITQASVLIQEPGTHNGTFSVTEDFAFKNLDTHTYVGSLDASKGKPNALLFSLPHGAKNIALNKGFDGYHVISVDTGFASDAALPPGDSEFAFSFDVPYSASTYDFSYVAIYPTVALSFLIPPDVNAHSGTLTAQGVITAQDQHSYRLFKASLLQANQQIHVALEGLVVPTPTASASSPLNPGTIWLIVALLLMLAIICATWFLLRVPRRPLAKKQQKITPRSGKNTTTRKVTSLKDSQVEDASASRKAALKRPDAEDIGAPGRVAPLVTGNDPGARRPAKQDRKEALLQELLELDKAYEAGKLGKAAYQERRAKTKARLRSIISEQEAARK
ncbi:MAG TPA: carboxypeptidase-like regulatory domain-containing protein [Ktedonosporobacter sp.]|nr:carboxypeptidase-like regulatory domain-containing protein [Ktedonosporobacter sp.]